MLVPIIVGSDKDGDFGRKIKDRLFFFGVNSVIRVCSAHKSCLNLLNIIKEYEDNDNVKTMITIAGKSNALSALVDGNSVKPIISCPPLSDVTMHDLYSSVSMPSGVAPLTVLGYENAAISASKICALFDKDIEKNIKDYKENMSSKLHINDIKFKYDDDYLSNDCLSSCISDTTKLCPKYNLVKTGKVRDVYSQGNYFDLVASDRISAFDRNLTTIPYKGIVLHKVSRWWFDKTKHLVPNHVLDDTDDRSMKVKQCKVFPIEFVMRSYLTGSTDTSIWKNYEKGVRDYCGHQLPDNMIKNQKLHKTLLTPTTKDEHDELISEQEIIEKKIMTSTQWDICKKYAYDLFEFGQEIASKNGLILVDTKYEFGIDDSGRIILIDELHTPDSSRFWIKHSYKDKMLKNEEPESIDKEIIRKWIKNTYKDPYDLSVKISIPDELRLKLSLKYLQLHELITGETI